MTRGRLIVWAVVWLVIVGAHALLTRSLAAHDPIAEVLLKRGESLLPLALVTLLLRVVLFVLLPPFIVTAVVRAVVDARSRRNAPAERI